jgi:trehalose-phosphatase
MRSSLLTAAPADVRSCPPLDADGDALFLDLDGTLAPIAPRPEDVRPDAALTRRLRALVERLDGRLAVVSGRSIADVDRILEGAVEAVAGVHGLERRSRAGVTRAVPPPGLALALSELESFVVKRDRLHIENKTLGLTIHYRQAPDMAADVRALALRLAATHGLDPQFGDMVAELKTPGADKGAAVRAFMAEPPFAGARPVFVGDDLTDEHGFAAAVALGGHGVLVGLLPPQRRRQPPPQRPRRPCLAGGGPRMSEADLDLFPIGNCSASALIDRAGRFVWACAPRVDADPVFSALLGGEDPALGHWTIDVEDLASTEQAYLRNTAVLRTTYTDANGAVLEVLDFCPRRQGAGRTYRPTAFVRLVRPVQGAPRMRMRLRPAADWGSRAAETTSGSNHIRYACGETGLRLSTNAPVGHVTAERVFRVERELAFFLGPDEPFQGDVRGVVRVMLDDTVADWRDWVRTLAVPLDYQAVVIRAAISLKLCVHEETGAIVAALTTSIPEAAGSGRNWDYRYCWIRDAYYVVQALNRLGAVDILEGYLGYLRNIVDAARGGHIQPVYGVGGEAGIGERIVDSLPGYRGMGPVRAGNQAHEHLQHDVYARSCSATFRPSSTSASSAPPTSRTFANSSRRRTRLCGSRHAGRGPVEFRTIARTHTYSAVMCWAACDRLANAAEQLGLDDRAEVCARALRRSTPAWKPRPTAPS